VTNNISARRVAQGLGADDDVPDQHQHALEITQVVGAPLAGITSKHRDDRTERIAIIRRTLKTQM